MTSILLFPSGPSNKVMLSSFQFLFSQLTPVPHHGTMGAIMQRISFLFSIFEQSLCQPWIMFQSHPHLGDGDCDYISQNDLLSSISYTHKSCFYYQTGMLCVEMHPVVREAVANQQAKM